MTSSTSRIPAAYTGVLSVQNQNSAVPANTEVLGTQMSSEATAAVFVALDKKSYYLPRFDSKQASSSGISHPRKRARINNGSGLPVESEIPNLVRLYQIHDLNLLHYVRL